MRFCFRRDLSKANVRAFVRGEMTRGKQTKTWRDHLEAKHALSLQERGRRSGKQIAAMLRASCIQKLFVKKAPIFLLESP